MAPPHMLKAKSKPLFQPKAGGKPVASRVEKKKSHTKTAELAFFANALTLRPKETAPTNKPTDNPADPMVLDVPQPAPTNPVSEEPLVAAPVNQEPAETALIDQVPEESIVTDVVMQDESSLDPNTMSATQTADNEDNVDDEDEPEPELVEKLFNLDDAIPRVGFQFPKERKGTRYILGRWKTESIVVKALYPDMEIIHKSKAQGVLSPVFHQAAKMIEDGTIQEYLARIEELTPGNSCRVWQWFLRKLWVDSKSRWPRRLAPHQFVTFFSALAEARWREEHQPKRRNGEQPGLLAQNVSLFLYAAQETGFAWSNGGGDFPDEDE